MSTFQLTYSGVIHPDDLLHQVVEGDPPSLENCKEKPDEHIIKPNYHLIKNKKTHRHMKIPYWAPTVRGKNIGYHPSTNCDGYFMSAKFKPNNNCYAYATNIATSSWPQPGRYHGYFFDENTLTGSLSEVGEKIKKLAEKDGLVEVGKTIEDITKYWHHHGEKKGGHFVALMISPAHEPLWGGDYHWARCDNTTDFSSWSQKDGRDMVTNYDFLGDPISNPAKANWTVNQGPQSSESEQSGDDMVTIYYFYCFMFVPRGSVHII
ncbi:MAG: hypothetical protein OEZ39_15670 [Gammaproteobacteria bacterium]|nr:hypothetical protein [Gammaproteobacteria bacterium]MDH5653295.1 hypothetical protein [Gammaproteobacteria bacterium]